MASQSPWWVWIRSYSGRSRRRARTTPATKLTAKSGPSRIGSTHDGSRMGGMEATYFFDPACPFTWRTSAGSRRGAGTRRDRALAGVQPPHAQRRQHPRAVPADGRRVEQGAAAGRGAAGRPSGGHGRRVLHRAGHPHARRRDADDRRHRGAGRRGCRCRGPEGGARRHRWDEAVRESHETALAGRPGHRVAGAACARAPRAACTARSSARFPTTTRRWRSGTPSSRSCGSTRSSR